MKCYNNGNGLTTQKPTTILTKGSTSRTTEGSTAEATEKSTSTLYSTPFESNTNEDTTEYLCKSKKKFFFDFRIKIFFNIFNIFFLTE